MFDCDKYRNAYLIRCIYKASPPNFCKKILELNRNNHTVNYEIIYKIISVMDQLISIYLTGQEQNYIDSNLEHYMSLLNMS